MNQYNTSETQQNIRFKTPYNSIPSVGEQNQSPSQTIPDQSMSVSEILRRFASGLPLAGKQVEMYEGEEDMWDGIDPRTLDISEREAIIAERAEELANIQKEQRNITKRQQQKAQEDITKEINRQLKLQTGQDQDTPEPE